MGAGIAGFEIDFGYTPNFFELTEGDADFDYGDNNLTTLMANLTLGAPIGGQSGIGLRPYASGGVGIIRRTRFLVDGTYSCEGDRQTDPPTCPTPSTSTCCAGVPRTCAGPPSRATTRPASGSARPTPVSGASG